MKNIAYIEIDTHAEIASAFMDLMNDSKVFSVDYYFSEKIRKQISIDNQNVCTADSSTILDLLSTKKYDLVIIGTVHRYFNTFGIIGSKFKTAIVVHNLNFSIANSFSLIKNIHKEDFIYRLKLWWKEGLFYSSDVYKKASKLLVLDQSLSSSSYQFMPLFYTKEYEAKNSDKLTVVIPGGVSQKRRDYKHVLDLIQKSNSKENIEFVFLGKARGEELNSIKKIANNFHIIYFEERVSESDFQFWMEKADLLWCPIQQKTSFFNIEETYGKTKMTGNIGDAISYGKIAVFPKNYTSEYDFVIPEKEDLIKQFYELKSIKYDFQNEFNKKNVLQKLEKVMTSII